jgi:dTMP kinase
MQNQSRDIVAKGLLITFEGGEGAGKTTLVRLMEQQLSIQGESVLVTRAPGGTAVGAKMRQILLQDEGIHRETELFLFLADRAQQVHDVIKPALLQGKVVLCDRFNDSTIAYQGGGRGFDVKWIEELCRFAAQGIEPDLTFYLDIDPSEGLSRAYKSSGFKDRIEEEDLLFHDKIRSIFLHLEATNPKRIHKLDAMMDPNTLLQEAAHVFQALCATHR